MRRDTAWCTNHQYRRFLFRHGGRQTTPPQADTRFIFQELRNKAGKQFDPFLVLKLLDIIERDSLLGCSSEALRAELIRLYTGPK